MPTSSSTQRETRPLLLSQEGHATPQLGQQLEELGEAVEQGRNAVLEAHRELLDMADDAIARVRALTRGADAYKTDLLCEVLLSSHHLYTTTSS